MSEPVLPAHNAIAMPSRSEGQPLRPSIVLAHERGGLALAPAPQPLHVTWPLLEEFVLHCQRCRLQIEKGHINGLEKLIRHCTTLLWCQSKTQHGGTLADKERAARADATRALPVGKLKPILATLTEWATRTRLLEKSSTLSVWMMNVLTAAVSAIASEARPVPAPEGAALLNVAVGERPTSPESAKTLCLLPPKDLGRRNFVPPPDWEKLCRELGFGWRGNNTPTCVYGWNGSWAMTYGLADQDAMAWFICGIDDHALVIRDGFSSHDVHLPPGRTADPASVPRTTPVSEVEVLAGAMDIDLQEYVHSLRCPPATTGLEMDLTDDLWWLCNGYDCAGPGYIWHGRAGFPAEIMEMSLSIWAAGSYDIPYDCAYRNVLTHSRYLIGKLDSLRVDRGIAYLAVAGGLMNNVISVLTSSDTASGKQGTLNWYLWALVIPRYSPGELLVGAAHQVDRAILDQLCAHSSHGTHLSSRDAWRLACQGRSEECSSCQTRPLSSLLKIGLCAASSSVLTRRVPMAEALLDSVAPGDVDWPTVEVFDRWIDRCLDLVHRRDPAAIPALDHNGNEVLLQLMRLAASENHSRVRPTVALCVLLSMAEGRNVSRLLGILNLKSTTALVVELGHIGEVP